MPATLEVNACLCDTSDFVANDTRKARSWPVTVIINPCFLASDPGVRSRVCRYSQS